MRRGVIILLVWLSSKLSTKFLFKIFLLTFLLIRNAEPIVGLNEGLMGSMVGSLNSGERAITRGRRCCSAPNQTDFGGGQFFTSISIDHILLLSAELHGQLVICECWHRWLSLLTGNPKSQIAVLTFHINTIGIEPDIGRKGEIISWICFDICWCLLWWWGLSTWGHLISWPVYPFRSSRISTP
jgi:hypothetical protein